MKQKYWYKIENEGSQIRVLNIFNSQRKIEDEFF